VHGAVCRMIGWWSPWPCRNANMCVAFTRLPKHCN
jgi:hypothetical protein